MSRGTIILLNGTTSAGKSTIARALQEVMDEPYLHSGPDHFQQAYPPDMLVITDDADMVTDGWLALYDEDGLRQVRVGPLGRQVIAGIYRAMAALSDSGLNVIVDSVFAEHWSLATAVSILRDYPAYFIAVDVPISIAEARERARGDRGPGNVRYFYDQVYRLNDIYDLRVDAAQHDPAACAREIKAFVAGNAPTALRHLAVSLNAELD